jgi:hypothetical protein
MIQRFGSVFATKSNYLLIRSRRSLSADSPASSEFFRNTISTLSPSTRLKSHSMCGGL